MPDLLGVREVGRERRRGLGQAVALEHVDADAAVEVAQPFPEGRAAGDGVRTLAAERGTQLGVDQPVEDAVLRRGPRRLGFPVSRPRDQAMATSAARPKILPRPSATARWEAVLNTFSKTRGTARMNVGRNSAKSSSRFLMSDGVAQTHARLDAADLDDPCEHVGQGEEEQRGGGWLLARVRRRLEELVQLVDRHGQLEHEVGVGEHAALGAAGRPRGVDQGGQVVRPGVRTTGLELLVGHVLAQGAQHPQPVALDRPDVVQLGEAVPDLLDARAVLRRSR